MASTRTKRPRKIFIDSSVLIAAAISPTGAGRKIINLGFAKRLDLYVSTDVLEETERNLRLNAPEALDLRSYSTWKVGQVCQFHFLVK